VLKNAGAVIALTKDMKEIMKRIFGRDIYIIPNGINLDAFKRPPIKSVPNLKSKDYEKVILFIGRLHPVKGVRYLIQAINILSAEGMVGVKLVIVGEGEERRSLEDYVKQLHLKEQVIFVGKIPNKKVPDYMAIADVFVLPSLSEGLPLVILEAMASGLPIIATRIGGLPEIIENGNNGFLVQPKNPKEIAEKLKLLLYNRELVEKMSQNNKKKAMNYSWEKIVYQLEEIYRRVIFR
jgi:glycosyltransferase involved in cell wall biosynthesis